MHVTNYINTALMFQRQGEELTGVTGAFLPLFRNCVLRMSW
jgi:hypothetical protein